MYRRYATDGLRKTTSSFSNYLQIPSTELMNMLEAGIFIVSLDGVIEYINPSLCKLFGFSREEMIYRHIQDLIGTRDKNFIFDNLIKQHHELAETYPFSFRRKDGSTLKALVAANAIFDKNKKIVGTMAVITEIKIMPIAITQINNVHDFQCGNLQIFPKSIEYAINGERFEISRFAFKLLSYFVHNHSRVISRAEIIEHVWENQMISDRVIDAHIVALRKKLRTFDGRLKMVYGLGYILKLNEKNDSNVSL